MGVAVQVQAYAMASHPEYVAERWHATLVRATFDYISIVVKLS